METAPYVSWFYAEDGYRTDSAPLSVAVRMRDSSQMAPLGSSYFTDGQGSLIWQGELVAKAGAWAGDVALTLFAEGGIQLAMSLLPDGVVDAVIDLTPERRVGVIGHPWLESEIDCVVRRMAQGEDPLTAVRSCLGLEATPPGQGGQGGGGAPTGGNYDELAEPDCSGGSFGVLPETVAWGPAVKPIRLPQPWRLTTSKIVEGPDGLIIRAEQIWENGTSARHTVIDATYGDGGLRRMEEVTAVLTVLGDGSEASTTTSRVTEYMPNGIKRVTTSQKKCAGGTCEITSRDVSDCDAETGECVAGACAGDSGYDPDDSGGSQPDPECEFEGDCAVADPRNDAESLWDCVVRTGATPLECLELTQSGVAVATGCVLVPGRGEQPELDCRRGSSPLGDCLTNAADLEECAGDAMSNGGDGVGPEGSEGGDDLGEDFRSAGQSGIDYPSKRQRDSRAEALRGHFDEMARSYDVPSVDLLDRGFRGVRAHENRGNPPVVRMRLGPPFVGVVASATEMADVPRASARPFGWSRCVLESEIVS